MICNIYYLNHIQIIFTTHLSNLLVLKVSTLNITRVDKKLKLVHVQEQR